MTAPLDGAATALMALGVSPWILPLIAIAAKRKEEAVRHPRRIRLAWWRGEDVAAADARARQQAAIDERLKARVEAVMWPD